MIRHIKNKEEYLDLINNNKVFVDFFATWCGPCRMLTPVIEELDEEGGFKETLILKVDVDENPEIAMMYGIQSIPTLLLIDKGIIINQSLGYINKSQLQNFINK